MFYYEKCVSKQAGGCFLVYSLLIKRLMFYYEKCVFKVSGTLPFSLLIINRYCTPKIFLLPVS